MHAVLYLLYTVCKVRPTLLDLHKVILRNIPNNSENSKRWLEFLTALDMRHEDIPCLTLSDSDARWNVYSVLDAWLNGSGSQPKTWGTLLRALHERGTPFLVKLACAAKEVYLSKLFRALVIVQYIVFTLHLFAPLHRKIGVVTLAI